VVQLAEKKHKTAVFHERNFKYFLQSAETRKLKPCTIFNASCKFNTVTRINKKSE